MKYPALDETDKRLLAALQTNADVSVEALAERLSLSRNTCWRRVARLEEAGVIEKRVALVNPRAVNAGLALFIAVRTSRHDAAWTENFRRVLNATPEFVGAYRTAGEIDYILHARVPDVAAYDALYQRLIAAVDLMDVSASFVMEEMKRTTEMPLNYA
jgi:Lrp/AsnC family transcriptional regulator